MAIPKSHQPRVEKFIRIVLERVLSGELHRGFFKKGMLDVNYTISLYSTTLLPLYNDERIELKAEINGKATEIFILDNNSLVSQRLDDNLISALVQAIMKLRVKEIK